jgi:hypothetical protein
MKAGGEIMKGWIYKVVDEMAACWRVGIKLGRKYSTGARLLEISGGLSHF